MTAALAPVDFRVKDETSVPTLSANVYIQVSESRKQQQQRRDQCPGASGRDPRWIWPSVSEDLVQTPRFLVLDGPTAAILRFEELTNDRVQSIGQIKHEFVVPTSSVNGEEGFYMALAQLSFIGI